VFFVSESFGLLGCAVHAVFSGSGGVVVSLSIVFGWFFVVVSLGLTGFDVGFLM